MNRLVCIILMLIYFAQASFAQSPKLKVTPADFDRWGTLAGEMISADGNWVSCKMEYESGNDTLFVINAKTHKTFDFPDAMSAIFSRNSKQAAIHFPGNRIMLIDLRNQKTKSYSGVTRFNFLSNGKYLLLQENESKSRSLSLFDKNNVMLWQSHDVADFNIGPKGLLAVITSNAIEIFDITQKPKAVANIGDMNSTKTNLVWSKSGNSVAFFSQSSEQPGTIKMMQYNFKTKSIATLKNNELVFGNKQYSLEGYGIVIADDDRQVYFSIIPLGAKPEEQTLVEMWEAESLLEHPQQQLYKEPEMNALLTVWDTDSGHVRTIDGDDFFNSKVLPGCKYALSQSKRSIVSRTEESAPADYYSTDMSANKASLVVHQGSTSAGAMKVSPSGRYISYFKEGEYYVFDNANGKLSNITAGMAVDFNNIEYDYAGSNPGYYSPGWTADSRFVILYDQYDIWLVVPDGKIAKRITKGRETKVRYRIAIDENTTQLDNFAEYSRVNINLQQGIVLSARGSDQTFGYYSYNDTDGLRRMHHGKSKSSRIVKAAEAGKYIFVEETAALPPRLMIFEKQHKTLQMIFQSNRHYGRYQWPRSELIAYKNKSGQELQGVLMYPAGYEIGKKYPMIVYIYERLSYMMYEYENPVSKHVIGFPPTSYLLDGYFVLMPDIKYEVGNPGLSAVDCVTAAVKKIKERGIIEENHIGLIGHSYGGYEVSYIVTQTPIFAAAVAGASITDLVSWYLTMNFSKRRSNSWSFESQQFRMGNSPFENWAGYIFNSPVAHAANITTPLLIWAGKKDASVNVEQSIELHLALRRLQKSNKMLLYPGQGHIVTDPHAQAHLTNSVKEWFDLYLKN